GRARGEAAPPGSRCKGQPARRQPWRADRVDETRTDGPPPELMPSACASERSAAASPGHQRERRRLSPVDLHSGVAERTGTDHHVRMLDREDETVRRIANVEEVPPEVLLEDHEVTVSDCGVNEVVHHEIEARTRRHPEQSREAEHDDVPACE